MPDDIAVGGFDDSPAATAASPALATIRQPWDRISNEMVRVLLAQMGGQDPAAGPAGAAWRGDVVAVTAPGRRRRNRSGSEKRRRACRP